MHYHHIITIIIISVITPYLNDTASGTTAVGRRLWFKRRLCTGAGEFMGHVKYA